MPVSRSRRDALSNVESLILAQAVWENGADSWTAVAKILSTHALISRPKAFFTAQSTQLMYQNLMNQAGLERTEACDAVHSPVNHSLAEKFYRARVQELRDQILAEEVKFKAIISDIDAIRSGNFDSEITAKVSGIPVTEPKVDQPTTSEEFFDGSELSVVTVTPALSSQSHELPSAPESLVSDMPLVASEGSAQTPTAPDDVPPSSLTPTPITMVEGNSIHDTTLPAIGTVPNTLNSIPPSSVPVAPQVDQASEQEEEEPMALDPDETREEEEEEEEEAMEAAGVRTPKDHEKGVVEEEQREGHRIEQSSSNTAGPIAEITESLHEEQEELTPVEEAPKSPVQALETQNALEVEAETAIEDGETSGEEPLHTSRRSTRRRRSTLSSVRPLPARGKARRPRPDSPVNIRDESEPEANEYNEDDTSRLEDGSPAPSSSRRGQEKRKASFVEGIDSPRDRKRMRDDSEPVEEDDNVSGHGRGRRSGIRSESNKRFQAVIGMLHSQISQHRNGNIFHNPIKNSEAPDYREIVKRPIDLKTIKMRVKDGSIGNSLEYQRDIMLMFANAMMYNRPGSGVHAMAEDMMVESEVHINAFRQTEGLVKSARQV